MPHTAQQLQQPNTEKPPRLVLVTPRFWPLAGGPEKVAARLGAEWVCRGWHVTVVTAAWEPGWPRKISFRGMPVVRLPHAPRSRIETFRYTLGLARWMRRNRDECDLVYVSGLKHDAYVVVRAVGGRVPVVLRAEKAGRTGDCLWQLDATCGRRIKRECMKAAGFVGGCAAIERELQAAGYPRPLIRHIPDGVPIGPPRSPSGKKAARSALAAANVVLEMPAWAPLAVCTGPLDREGGLEHLLAAWRTIVARWPNARLWLAGERPDRATLARMIEAVGMTGRVLPVGVFDEVDELLAAADLFVLPSPRIETPVALLEAMAAGLPVVAAEGPGHRATIVDGEHGLLVPATDTAASSSAAWSAAIERLLDKPELAAELGTAGRERALADFALAQMVDQHVTWFEQLIRTTQQAQQ